MRVFVGLAGQITKVFVAWRSDHAGVCGLAVRS